MSSNDPVPAAEVASEAPLGEEPRLAGEDEAEAAGSPVADDDDAIEAEEGP